MKYPALFFLFCAMQPHGGAFRPGWPAPPASDDAIELDLTDGDWSEGVASFYRAKTRHQAMWGTKLLVASNRHRPGTRLTVVNARSGKRVTVIVCGTGPFVRGRSLDLSREAFRCIELPSRGLCRVQYRMLSRARGGR